jgi:alkylhydroperoxidase/carboxymuconolactone decarboxylase family protein YurZ
VPKPKNALQAKGKRLREQIAGASEAKPAKDGFLELLEDAENELGWGMVWARPGLSTRMRAALALVMVASVGRESDVKAHARMCIRQGWSVEEIGEILLHMLVYAGLCRTRMAFEAASEAFAALGVPVPAVEGGQGSDVADDEAARLLLAERIEAGRRVRGELFGAEFVDRLIGGPDPFMDIFNDVTHAYAFASVWKREGLDLRSRILVALAIAAVTGQLGGVKRHVRSAVTAGIPSAEIGEVLLQAYVYGGAPVSVGSFNTAKEIFREMGVDEKSAAAG